MKASLRRSIPSALATLFCLVALAFSPHLVAAAPREVPILKSSYTGSYTVTFNNGPPDPGGPMTFSSITEGTQGRVQLVMTLRMSAYRCLGLVDTRGTLGLSCTSVDIVSLHAVVIGYVSPDGSLSGEWSASSDVAPSFEEDAIWSVQPSGP